VKSGWAVNLFGGFMVNQPTIQCPACHEQTPSAKFCSRCGADLSKARRTKKGHPVQKVFGISFLVLIAILGVYAVASAGSRADNTPNGSPSVVRTSPTSTPTPLQMTIGDLQGEYDANQLAADAKFEGRWMQVTGGEILNINPSSVLIHYSAGSQLFSVWALRCKFDEDDPTVLTLTRGQIVNVFGQNDGMSFGQVDLNHCSFISVSKPKTTISPEA
jgi:hypothetical protein